jgi:hypothetical protein
MATNDGKPHYRLTFGALNNEVWVDPRALDGVVYGGGGIDDIGGADLQYGGPGNDSIGWGTRLYGGPGNDFFQSVARFTATGIPVASGGPGHDFLMQRGLLYGGPGRDALTDLGVKWPGDMLVGGPGQDTVYLGRDHRRDVVRVRGGGVDRVACLSDPDPGDALFVDRTDILTPACKHATVLYTEPPRYPYP